eukprot:6213193-Pleurochrysis_carterae.AAC.3
MHACGQLLSTHASVRLLIAYNSCSSACCRSCLWQLTRPSPNSVANSRRQSGLIESPPRRAREPAASPLAVSPPRRRMASKPCSRYWPSTRAWKRNRS